MSISCSPFSCLPNELIVNIFSYLNDEQRALAASVCLQWNRASDQLSRQYLGLWWRPFSRLLATCHIVVSPINTVAGRLLADPTSYRFFSFSCGFFDRATICSLQEERDSKGCTTIEGSCLQSAPRKGVLLPSCLSIYGDYLCFVSSENNGEECVKKIKWLDGARDCLLQDIPLPHYPSTASVQSHNYAAIGCKDKIVLLAKLSREAILQSTSETAVISLASGEASHTPLSSLTMAAGAIPPPSAAIPGIPHLTGKVSKISNTTKASVAEISSIALRETQNQVELFFIHSGIVKCICYLKGKIPIEICKILSFSFPRLSHQVRQVTALGTFIILLNGENRLVILDEAYRCRTIETKCFSKQIDTLHPIEAALLGVCFSDKSFELYDLSSSTFAVPVFSVMLHSDLAAIAYRSHLVAIASIEGKITIYHMQRRKFCCHIDLSTLLEKQCIRGLYSLIFTPRMTLLAGSMKGNVFAIDPFHIRA